MSDDIRIVVDVDSSGAVRGVSTAKGALRSLGTETRNTARSSDIASAAWSRQQKTLTGLERTAKRATLSVAGIGAYGLAQAVKSGLKFNANMESNRIALEQFTGSSAKADKMLRQLFQVAAKTPFQFQDVTTAARKFLAFGFTAQQTSRALKAVGDAVAGIGGGAPEIERAVLALGQMQAKGRVQAQELLQLEQLGIPATRILKQELGLTATQVANIGKQGIAARDGIDALTKGMEERFGGATQRQAKSMKGQLSTLQDYASQTFGAMTHGLFIELEKWMPQVNKTAQDITAIWGRKDLTPTEKFRESRDTIEKDLGPLFDQIKQQWDDAHVGQFVTDEFNKALPKIAEMAGKAGIKAAGAFGHAFVDSSPLGRLVLAGYLLQKTGGIAAFRAAGVKAGAGFAEGEAGAIAASSGRLRGLLGRALAGAGVGAAIAFGPDLAKTAQSTNPVFDALKNGGQFGAGAEIFRQAAEKLGKAGDSRGLAELATQIRAVGREAGAAGPQYEALADKIDASIRNKAIPAFEAMHKAAGKSMTAIKQQVADSTFEIQQTLGYNTAAGKDALARNFQLAAQAVEASMKAGEISTKTGLALIESYMRKALAQYGITGKQASRYLNGADTLTGKSLNGSAGAGKAMGGYIGSPGEAGADNVPIVVGRGEAVLNRHQQGPVEAALHATYGMGLSDLFAQTSHTRHYMASGGFAGLKPGIASATRRVLNKFPGLVVTSTTGGTHAPGSYHYRGEAADIAGAPGLMNAAAAWIGSTMGRGLTEGIHNPNLSIKFGQRVPPGFWGASTWAGHANHIHLAVAGALKAAGFSDAQIKRVRMQGGLGAISQIGQAGLDRVRAAAQAALAGAAGSGSSPDGAQSPSAGAGALSLGQIKALWIRAGGPPGIADLMAHVAMAESSGRPGIVNSIGATGLWQIYPGGKQYLDPLANARAAVAKYRSGGLRPWDASRPAWIKYMASGGFVSKKKKPSFKDWRKRVAPTTSNLTHGKGAGSTKKPPAPVTKLNPLNGKIETHSPAVWKTLANQRAKQAYIKAHTDTAVKSGGEGNVPQTGLQSTTQAFSGNNSQSDLTVNEQAFLDFFDGQLAMADVDTPFTPYDSSNDADSPFDPNTGQPAVHNPGNLDDDLTWAGRKAYLLEHIYADRKARNAPVAVQGRIAQMLKTARSDLATLQAEHDAKQERPTVAPDTSIRDSLLQTQRDQALSKLALQGQQLGVLQGFAPMLAGRFVGSFARGGEIKATGLALVHAGETVQPNPQGPFGNQITQQTSVHPKIEVNIHGDSHGFVRHVETMVDGKIQRAQEIQGRRQRLFATAGVSR